MTGQAADSPDWVAVKYGNKTAFVMIKFLSTTEPSQAEKTQAEITHEMNNYKAAANPFVISAKPDNPETGWVNFRSQPSTGAPRIGTLKMGQTLTVIGETTDWYKAIDSVSGRTGYVSKSFTVRLLK